MKRYLSLILALLLLLSVNVCALSLDKYNFGITPQDDWAVITQDNISSNNELVVALGHSTASMQQYFNDNSLILYAVSPDMNRQMQVTCRQTEFSKQMEDISLLADKDVLDMVNHFVKVNTASDLKLVTVGGIKLYEVTSLDKDSGGAFCTVQYITVRGGMLYTISFFENADKINQGFKDLAFNTISTLTIKGAQKVSFSGAENITEIIIVALLLILAAAVAVSLVISLVRDFFHRDEGERTIVIRRRRK